MSDAQLIMELKSLRYAIERRAPVRGLFMVGLIEGMVSAVAYLPWIGIFYLMYRYFHS